MDRRTTPTAAQTRRDSCKANRCSAFQEGVTCGRRQRRTESTKNSGHTEGHGACFDDQYELLSSDAKSRCTGFSGRNRRFFGRGRLRAPGQLRRPPSMPVGIACEVPDRCCPLIKRTTNPPNEREFRRRGTPKTGRPAVKCERHWAIFYIKSIMTDNATLSIVI